MPIRDVVVTAVILAGLPMCFIQPWFGILMWSWIGYMNPHRLTWDFAATMPFALMVAAMTLPGWLITKDRKPLPREPEVYLIAALFGSFVWSSMFALYPDQIWDPLTKIAKVFFMLFVTLTLFQDQRRLRLLLLVTALSMGFYGFKVGLFGIHTGVDSALAGPEGTFFGDNVSLAVALNTSIPLLVLIARTDNRRWVRLAIYGTVGLSCVAVLATMSRAGLLGLGAVLTMLLLKSRRKVLVLATILVAAALVVPMLPDSWFARMDTIRTYEEDRSAQQRLAAWKLSYIMALNRPLTGGGFGMYHPEQYALYVPELIQRGDAHSIYFQIMGEHGWPGFLIFVALLGTTYRSLARLRRLAERDPERRWVGDWAQMLQASLVGFMVSGAFISLAYFDLFYQIIVFAVLLKVVTAAPTVPASALEVSPEAVPAQRPRVRPVRPAIARSAAPGGRA